ncbi:MAG TPA: iron ABC transporter permease [Bacillota bacterium]|nr:iron ABC transporter permease [Bacillota bacterium]HOH09941.1 iron ABC transporter permease [Bacillota bacterium]HPI01591.1 iron ABC transporter permease [Bacillota bacterium]HPM63362.1 iron ABC transporter permease [Bacillota bacterium]HQJ23729.1 iron ABC transporter permease [Bacillota bacterium]
MNDRGGMGMVKFRRWLKVSNPWVWPIFLFLAFFVIFPLVKLFVDSFTTADVPLSPLREAIMTVDLMEEKIASGDEEEAKAALDDLLVQIERSETSITRTTAALGAALTSQQKSIDRWNEVLSELGVIKSALAGMTTPEEATGEARKLKELMSKAVQLPNKAFSVKFFFDVFKDKVYMKALVNSLTLGFASVVTSSIIGFSVAYLLVRYEFPGRKLFNFLTMIPIVMPPLVGVLGFIFILGRGGTVNELFYLFAQKIELTWPALSNWLFDHLPFNFVYGWHGLLMVETLHLFPLITLNVVDSLSKIDASLEEAAESMGSVGFKRLFDITIPLTVPGFVTGALLVFIWAFADFATPHVVGLNNFIAPLAFMDIQQFIDRNLFKMGITVGAVMVMWSIVFLIVAKKYVSMKDYSTLSYRPVERRPLSKGWSALALVFLISLMLFAFIPYLGVGLASFARGWSMTPLPTTWTLHHYKRVIFDAPGYIINTFNYCTLAVILCILIGLPIAWIMARTKMRSRGALDILTTLVLALPGTALGIAYIRAFNTPILIKQPLANIWIIIPIVLAVRRLPYTVRSSYSSLIVVHRSMEEAAESVGASVLKTFKDVTMPLIWKGVLAGALFSFMTSIQESATTILLSIPGWETMTVGIFNFYTGGTHGDAAALGFILIIVGIVTLYIVNRLSSTRAGGGFFG